MPTGRHAPGQRLRVHHNRFGEEIRDHQVEGSPDGARRPCRQEHVRCAVLVEVHSRHRQHPRVDVERDDAGDAEACEREREHAGSGPDVECRGGRSGGERVLDRLEAAACGCVLPGTEGHAGFDDEHLPLGCDRNLPGRRDEQPLADPARAVVAARERAPVDLGERDGRERARNGREIAREDGRQAWLLGSGHVRLDADAGLAGFGDHRGRALGHQKTRDFFGHGGRHVDAQGNPVLPAHARRFRPLTPTCQPSNEDVPCGPS